MPPLRCVRLFADALGASAGSGKSSSAILCDPGFSGTAICAVMCTVEAAALST